MLVAEQFCREQAALLLVEQLAAVGPARAPKASTVIRLRAKA